MKRLCASTLALLFLAACEFRSDNRPSLILIAVENLSSDSVRCDTEDLSDGFGLLCEESIRFTHAFSPSTMAQATMSSMLTGYYPTRHGVHDNGFDHLLARFRTIGEAAVDKGYRTAFVSGGPPVFRKSGLSQGFELFDDNLDVSLGRYYRPASEVVHLFADWLTREDASGPVLAVLFLPDLQFPRIPAFTQSGELRETTESTQLQVVGESMRTLVEMLKAHKRWDSTYIILTGLDGGSTPGDLKSVNTQVPLLIKPARGSKEAPGHWTIDRNVSLVDVGVTLFSVLGEPVDPIDNEVLEKVSLSSALSVPEPDWRDDRIIYTESGWTRWRLGGDIRIALRQKQFLFLNDQTPQVFNSVIDRVEKTPVVEKDASWLTVKQDFTAALEHLNAVPSKPLAGPQMRAIEIGRALWTMPQITDAMQLELNAAIQRADKDPTIVGWWARWAMEKEDWKTLAKLGVSARKALWTYAGDGRAGDPVKSVPDSIECASVFRGSPTSANCNDEGLLSLVRWMQEKNDEERLSRRDRFLRLYANERVQDRVGQLNYLNGAAWDVRMEFPRAPLLTELYLALSRNRTYSAQINSWLSSKDLSL